MLVGVMFLLRIRTQVRIVGFGLPADSWWVGVVEVSLQDKWWGRGGGIPLQIPETQ